MKFSNSSQFFTSTWKYLSSPHALTLEQHFASKKRNNFDFVRLFAACMVLFGHSFTLILASPENRFPHDPVTLMVYDLLPFAQGLPGTGLHIFFFISGVLVTRSFFNHRTNLIAFVKARVLRIVPAFWVCTLLIAFVVGPWMSTLSFHDYVNHPGTWMFAWKNMLFSIVYTLPSVFVNNPFGPSVNGSVWTIPLELQMYVWVLFLGGTGVLGKRYIFTIFLLICILFFCLTGISYIFIPPWGEPRLWIFFFSGTLATVYADKLKISLVWMCVSGLLIGLSWQHGNRWFDILGAAWLSYALLVFCFFHYFKNLDIGLIGDFSYGIYLYAFPVQQVLIHFFKEFLNGWLVAVITLVITMPLAAMSWYLIEKPMLKLK